MKSVIYLIKNMINNKVYIGSAVNIDRRWRVHKKDLNKGKHHSCHLQLAWNKYGEQNFNFEILQEVENPEHLLSYEQVYLDYYKSYERDKGYNTCKIAGSTYGIKYTEESRKKMKGRIVSEETRKKMSEAKKNQSEETKRKIGEASKGRNVGRKHTEEESKKMSEARKGFKHTEETKNKIREANKGKTYKYKRVPKLDCKFYSFIEKKKKYIVRIFKKYIGYYNTEEEARQAVVENLEKFKTQQIASQ